jgi:hypothetical protein
MIIQALNALGINSDFYVDADVTTEEHYLRTYRDLTNQNRFFEWSVVSAKMQELQAAEPMRLLREQRNHLLQQSDWMALSDRVMTQSQIDYRQALRDITTQSPSLDENGQLTGITWPTPPTD